MREFHSPILPLGFEFPQKTPQFVSPSPRSPPSYEKRNQRSTSGQKVNHIVFHYRSNCDSDDDNIIRSNLCHKKKNRTKKYKKGSEKKKRPLSLFEVAHLFQPVEVIFVDLELKASLEALSLWHLHIHWTNVLLTFILLLLPQTAKVTKWQLLWLV